jgi:hypothetical protein
MGNGPVFVYRQLLLFQLGDFWNTLHATFRGDMLPEPDIRPPPTKKRGYGDHCKRDTECYTHNISFSSEPFVTLRGFEPAV